MSAVLIGRFQKSRRPDERGAPSRRDGRPSYERHGFIVVRRRWYCRVWTKSLSNMVILTTSICKRTAWTTGGNGAFSISIRKFRSPEEEPRRSKMRSRQRRKRPEQGPSGGPSPRAWKKSPRRNPQASPTVGTPPRGRRRLSGDLIGSRTVSQKQWRFGTSFSATAGTETVKPLWTLVGAFKKTFEGTAPP
jgi:hypothetical protein